MARQNAIRISKRTVDALTVESGDAVFWDRELTGFGVRVYATGRKVYVVQTRGPAGSLKRVTIGRDVVMTAETARRTAAEAIDRIRSGEDPFPAPPAPEATVADLAERYMKAHVEVNCRPGTVGVIPARGRPLHPAGTGRASDLGGRAVACVGPAFQDAGQAVSGEPDGERAGENVQAGRGVGHDAAPAQPVPVGAALQGASSRALSEPGRSTGGSAGCWTRRKKSGRFLPSGIAAIRLLVLTGCRKNEIVTLRWDDIDRTAGEIRLRDSKTGARRIPLTPAVEWVLAGIPRIEGNPWVIPGKNPGDHLKNLDQIWLRLRPRAGLDNVRIHDARHSYASRALALGESLPMIGRLLGHRKVTTTARYAHLARDTEKASAVKVGASIGADILNRDGHEGRAA